MSDVAAQARELRALLDAHDEHSTVATDATIRASARDLLDALAAQQLEIDTLTRVLKNTRKELHYAIHGEDES